MALSMRRIVHAMINAEFSDGLGQTIPHEELVLLNTPKRLRESLLKARQNIQFALCSDVAQLKVDEIDTKLPFPTRREIARACKRYNSGCTSY